MLVRAREVERKQHFQPRAQCGGFGCVADADRVYANYLWTCAMLNIEPVSRERARAFIGEWNEVLSGRPEPTTH